MDQFMYDLAYCFDYSMRMVLDHPFLSVVAVVAAFLAYQALSAMKLILSVITFALAALTALLVGWLFL